MKRIGDALIKFGMSPTGIVSTAGIDVHIEKYVVVMKIDGSAPERAKRFTPEAFLDWSLSQKLGFAELRSNELRPRAG